TTRGPYSRETRRGSRPRGQLQSDWRKPPIDGRKRGLDGTTRSHKVLSLPAGRRPGTYRATPPGGIRRATTGKPRHRQRDVQGVDRGDRLGKSVGLKRQRSYVVK